MRLLSGVDALLTNMRSKLAGQHRPAASRNASIHQQISAPRRDTAVLLICAGLAGVACDYDRTGDKGPSDAGASSDGGQELCERLALEGDLIQVLQADVVAGTGTEGFNDGNGQPGGDASFRSPVSVAVDVTGTAFIADRGNDAVRVISPELQVQTLAGGTDGFRDGTGGREGVARFRGPNGIAVAPTGEVFITDIGNHAVRKIDSFGTVTTVAGNGISGDADVDRARLTSSSVFSGPSGIAVDSLGNVYVADQLNNRVKRIAVDGGVSTLAGNGLAGFRDGSGGRDGTAMFNRPAGVAVGDDGVVYVADSMNGAIRKIERDGSVSTVAGTGTKGWVDGIGGANGTAQFHTPQDIVLGADGSVFVADAGNRLVRRISREGRVQTIGGKEFCAQMRIGLPAGLAIDGTSLLIADLLMHRVWRVTLVD